MPMLGQTTLAHSLENPDDKLKRLRERVAEQTVLIAQLRERIRELAARLAKDSHNSSRAAILGLSVQEAATTLATPTQRAQARWTTGPTRCYSLPGRSPRPVRDHPVDGDLRLRTLRHRDRGYSARGATPSGRGGDPA